jgi:serine/threonine-protein kinase
MTDDSERWTRVNEVFDAALERSPEERSAYLRKACGNDETLRTRVEVLLEAHEAVGSFLARPLVKTAAPLKPGDRLGPYEIVGPLGAGGLGAVYRGRDIRLLRDVAIKVLKDGVDALQLARFEREARTIAALSHPNVVTIFDVGLDGDVPFLVTELLEGESLRARLNRQSVPVVEAVAVARQVAAGVAAAHEKQIVHRDLKPENVFLLAGGAVKVLDFGLAKMHIRETDGDDAALITDQGRILGTVAYMAPEQVRGLPLDARTDVFAIGVILFEMLAGKRPFAGTSIADTMSAILAADPPPIPECAAVATALESVVRRALSKAPEQRFESARQLLTALDVAAGPSEMPAGRKRPLHDHRDSTSPSLAVLPFADLSPAKDHDYFCEGLAEELISGLARVRGLRVASPTASFRFRGREINLQDLGASLDVRSVLEGSVRTAGRRLRIAVRLTSVDDGRVEWSEQFDRDFSDVFAVQDEIARAVIDALGPQFAQGMRLSSAPAVPDETGSFELPFVSAHAPPQSPARHHLRQRPDRAPARTPAAEAYTLYLKGRFHWNKRTEGGMLFAIDCFERACTIDPAYARAAAAMASAWVTVAIYGLRPAADAMPRAEAAATHALLTDAFVPDAYAARGSVRSLYRWSWNDALQDLDHAVELDPADGGALHWRAMHGLAPQGRFDEALVSLERALALDPVSLPIVASVGLVRSFAGDHAASVAALRNALTLDASFPLVHAFLGSTLSEMGELPRALEHLRTAVALTHRTPEAVAALGCGLASAGHEPDARQILGELDARAATEYVSPVLTAQLHTALHEYDRAIARLSDACEARATDLAWIGVRPVFRPLRSMREFQALLGRLGLSGKHAP